MSKAGKRRHADQRALELTNVVGDIGGNELEHIVGYGGFLKFCFLAENRQPGLKIGRLDVGDQPPFEPAPQTILEGRDCTGWPVRREHQLPAGSMQGVERMEELLL